MLRKLLFASLFAISSLAGAADRATELRQLYDEFWEENL